MINKQRKIRGRTRLATIKRAQFDTTASARFLLTALHSVYQAITRENTNKIAIYNKKETACCADSGESEYILPDYSTFKKYHRLSNIYAALGDNTRPLIKVIGTAVYTLSGRTILTCNVIHITALGGPLYYLRKHRKISGCVVYYSYKDGSYLFFPNFILQSEYSYANIFSYQSLGASHQCAIDYIEPKSTSPKAIATPSGCPSTSTT